MNDAFRQLFDQVKSGVIWMQRNGVVRYANKAAVQMTPVMLGQVLMDPVAERTVKAAGQDMLKLPFQFELTTLETSPDTIRAVVIGAPVGSDLMLVLNNVSEERWYSQALENLIGYIEAEMAHPIEALAQKLPQIARLVQEQGATGELAGLVNDASCCPSWCARPSTRSCPGRVRATSRWPSVGSTTTCRRSTAARIG